MPDEIKDPNWWFAEHMSKFDIAPDVTIIRMTEGNGGLFIAGVKKALERGTPLTDEECHKIGRETFKEFYDRLDAGERIVF